MLSCYLKIARVVGWTLHFYDRRHRGNPNLILSGQAVDQSTFLSWGRMSF